MKGLKFRCWDTKNKSFVNDMWIDLNGMVYEDGGYGAPTNLEDTTDFDRYIITQFIGLSDKNEKPIFEGDILKLPDQTIMEIPFLNFNPIYLLDGFEEDIEIIGNKFENPKLLLEIFKCHILLNLTEVGIT